MQARWRYIPEILTLLIAVFVQFKLADRLLETHRAQRSERLRHTIRVATLVMCLWLFFGFAFSMPALSDRLPHWPWLVYLRAGAMLWATCSTGAVVVYPLWKGVERFNPERRRALLVLRDALAVAPIAAAGYGTFIERSWFRITEVNVAIPGLPKALDGLRVAQLTDIHLSAFLSVKELARVVDMANETRPHLALVTGDIITGARDPLEAGMRQLARLRADAGTLGCLGNHEVYARSTDLTANLGARHGIPFLRRAARRLKFAAATLNVAGVDYQRLREPYLRGAEALMVPGATNILLSHNPDVFPVAARQGWALTIAGHTHGGQISVEILGENLSVARLYTPYVHGLYRSDSSAIYVSRGVGTVGVPTRVGAPPEVSLIRLCAI
jgi:uncharacterized protein